MSPEVVGAVLVALPIFAALAAMDLGIDLITSDTVDVELLILVGVFTLWVAFALALVFNRGMLDEIWQTLRRLHVAIQGAAWVLFLPDMIALWIWERKWT